MWPFAWLFLLVGLGAALRDTERRKVDEALAKGLGLDDL